MATIKINVKWGKENVPCEIKPGQTPDQLFDDLQSKTGVPVARQKLMARGAWRGVLKSGMAMDLKDGQNVTLMGTADVLLKPKVETKFLEDMKVRSQRLRSGLDAIVSVRRGRGWSFFRFWAVSDRVQALRPSREPVVAVDGVDAMPRRRGAVDAPRFRAGGGPGQEWISTPGGLREFGEHVLHEFYFTVFKSRP